MRFVVVGGGYAGQAAIKSIISSLSEESFKDHSSNEKKLYAKNRHEIILIDKNPYATVLPLLPDLVVDKVTAASVKGDFKNILPKGVKFVQGEIESLDLESKKMRFQGQNDFVYGLFEFDALVITCGSKTNVKPCDRFTGKYYCLDSLKETMFLSRELEDRKLNGKPFDILIIGAGYTAIELAGNLEYGCRSGAEKLANIHILSRSGDILKNVSKTTSEHLVKYLTKIGIKIHKQTELKVWDGEKASLGNGEVFLNPIVIAASGMTSSMKYEENNFVSLSVDGRIEVDNKLRVNGYKGIYAAGDAAALKDSSGGQLRRSVNFAIYSGAVAGRNSVKYFNNCNEKDFNAIDLGWVIPVHGESYGKLFGVIPITGNPGLRLHYLMCGLRNFTLKNCFYYIKKAFRLFGSKGEDNEKK